MATKMVLGIGNALTDILISATDEQLADFELPKGSMQLISAERMRELQARLGRSCTEERCAGGCASNTVTGLGELGVEAAFIGKIGRDETGSFFERDLKGRGVESRMIYGDSPSGTVLAFITPDTERTFATHLGAAVELSASDLTQAMFTGCDYFHIEGYLVQNHDLISTAIDLAKASGALVSIDLASYNVVEENLDFLKGLIGKGLDVVFANEDEAKVFTGKPEKQALEILAGQCRTAVVKLGPGGSLIASGKERIQVEGAPIQAVDTTGAGDLYATGFLYGLVHEMSLSDCGRVGDLVAREIIQVRGTKLAGPTWERIRKGIRDIQADHSS